MEIGVRRRNRWTIQSVRLDNIEDFEDPVGSIGFGEFCGVEKVQSEIADGSIG